MRRAGASRVRWWIGGGALIMAAVTFYVLANVGNGATNRPGATGPALDDIDASSRAELRELLREADEGR